ncbi:RDD family protein [Streptomyces sp. NPDC000987]|uniref:RDD family protein n=1 Tax=Streptomyces sp. NPDC000987 TaxID=3154374 RepID=UPI003322ECCE
MSAPTPAPGDDRPREGYYPDPSIPGYVRYWNGAAWVPGTSRPAPADGERLVPPPGAGPAPAAVEETGPHFFDEDPQPQASPADAGHGSRPEPASAWGADRSHQTGFGGGQDRRVSWGAPQGADPRVPAGPAPQPAGPAPQPAGPQSQPAGPRPQSAGLSASTDGTATIPPADEAPGQAPAGQPTPGQVSSDGTFVFRRPTGTAQGSPHGAGTPGGSGAGAAPSAGPAAPGAQGPGGPVGDDGTMIFRTPSPRAERQGSGPGFGAGKAAAERAATAQAQAQAHGQAQAQAQAQAHGQAQAQAQAQAHGQAQAQAQAQAHGQAQAQAQAQAHGQAQGQARAAAPQTAPAAPAAPMPPVAPAPSPAAPSGPQQVPPAAAQPPAARPAPAPAAQVPSPAPAPAPAPVTTGPGGGQPSWAQQVHRLAGATGGEQPVAPWKPPVEDVFQAAARRQAAARPAGLGKRLVARLLDTVVVAGVTAVAAVPLGAKALDHVDEKIDAAKLSGETVTVWLLDGTTSACLGAVLAVLLLSGVLYEALPTAKWGRTLGKKLLGLEVRDIEAHEPPSFGAALRRWLVYSVPGVLLIGVVGVLWCLFDRPWRQCWHDKAAHTFVAG